MLLKYLTLQRLNLNKGELQMNIQEERDALFDEHFKPKSQNIERIKKFCQEISSITGVQVCNDKGMIYEYIAQVYQSALKKLEEK
jgi:hypothetical protein